MSFLISFYKNFIQKKQGRIPQNFQCFDYKKSNISMVYLAVYYDRVTFFNQILGR